MGLFNKESKEVKLVREFDKVLKKAETTLKIIDLKTESLYASIEELKQTKNEILRFKTIFNLKDQEHKEK